MQKRNSRRLRLLVKRPPADWNGGSSGNSGAKRPKSSVTCYMTSLLNVLGQQWFLSLAYFPASISRHDTVRQFGDNHKVKLGKNHSKTNGVKLSKMASGLWVSLRYFASPHVHRIVTTCLSALPIDQRIEL